ncbi:SDR family NAD(P)-dependent oxidoreductase [Comamonas composti]|uniref:SDR family NAD(P)-dependent oxidoreductase n=1 Tax=Comamonas composti TaxID=408558 RepID=UPI00040AB56B|nr:SDR family NAD(P)-dependent oxidoreductase [Comamonas composti]
MQQLKDKVCIITGGAGSLGLAGARKLLAHGGRVLLVDSEPARLDAAMKSLDAAHGHLAAHCADVGDSGQSRAYVQSALNRWGRLDVLICCAGISGAVAPITEYDEAVFERVMRINLLGCFLACKHGLPFMKEGGSVILVSSVVGVTADAGICAYASSKHGLMGLMRVAAKEAGARGIRVNALAPGPVDNGFQLDIEQRLSLVVGRDASRMLESSIALGRHGRAEEVAELMLFLASDAGSFCTGGIYMADGGMSI